MCCKKKQTVKVTRMAEHARLPRYASEGAAAADVHSLKWKGVDGSWYEGDCLIAPGSSVAFGTGLKFEVPAGFELKVHSRSGHGFNKGIRLSNCTGIIDSDYRGELMVKLHNDSGEVVMIERHERICQVQVSEAIQHEFVEVGELTVTQRGEGGLGSTGAV